MAERRVKEALLAEVALRAGIVSREQVALCQAKRREGDERSVGELLVSMRYLTSAQLEALRAGRYRRQRGRFGEIAYRMALVDRDAVKAALKRQRERKRAGEPHLAVGQLLRDAGAISKHQVRAVLSAQGKTVCRCQSCRLKFTITDFSAGDRCRKCDGELTPVKVRQRPTQPPEPSEAPDVPDPEDDDDSPTDDAPEELFAPRRRRALTKGTDVRGYVIRESLGSDMTGALYRARELSSGRLVSLKVLDAEALATEASRRQFLAQAAKAARLQHASIKRLEAVGKLNDGRVFVVMEYVAGDSLRQLLRRARRLPAPTVVMIGCRLTDALIHASDRGLVHRDLRPSNVVLTESGDVRLAGFGVPVDLGGNLRLFATGEQQAACYLAPELVVSDAIVDARADIFGLGCLLYHLLGGRPPLRGRAPVDVLLQMSERGIPPLRKLAPDAPPELVQVITRMIELEPTDRYPSLYQLERELQAIAAGFPELSI